MFQIDIKQTEMQKLILYESHAWTVVSARLSNGNVDIYPDFTPQNLEIELLRV